MADTISLLSDTPLKPSLQLPPLSLYIHIPWCIKKCPYCDFNSHENNTRNLPELDYFKALKQDLLQDSQWIQGRKLHSIFFGGGTPSLFSEKTIEKILMMAESIIGFEENIEITLEANPGTFEQEKFKGFFACGVNRLSIGVQSFQERHLQTLGRVHNSNEAIHAIEQAKCAGFKNINIDLMHGLPQQTIEEATQDLHTAIALQPQHISWYQLTIEPNTVFYHQKPTLPNDDRLADIQGHGHQLLIEQSYQQYEVSAFSQPQYQSKHNVNYWSFGDYIGVGAGAHGKLTDVKQQRIIRRQKTRQPNHYLSDKKNVSFKESLVPIHERSLEFLMNALRMNQGVPISFFEARTGLPFEYIQSALAPLTQQGLVEFSSGNIKTTELGQQFLNTVLTKIMEAEC